MLQETVSPRQANDNYTSLKNKRILVTGGTTGIGRATARLLAREGANLMIYGRDPEKREDAVNELKKITEKVHGITADQSKIDTLDDVFKQVDQALGGLDILINNAAVGASSVTDTPTEEWVCMMNTDLLAYMKCAELAVPRLKANGGGWIVNVGSMSAKLRDPGSDVYVAAKMGVRGFSDSLGRLVAEDMIHVTLIEPGLVVSEMNEMSGEEQVEKQDKLEMILGEDIGRAIVYVLTQPKRVSIPFIQVRPIMQKI